MATAKAGVITDGIIGATGKMILGSSPQFRSGTIFQLRGKKIIVQKKTIRRQRTTAKQQKQRDKFCNCDSAYREMTQEQKDIFRKYVAYLNKKTKKHSSVHAWWMKLCLTDGLDEFFEKWLKLEFIKEVVEETETGKCYTIYAKPQSEEYISLDTMIDQAAKRR